MEKTWKEKYKRMSYVQRSHIDAAVKKHKKRRKIVRMTVRTIWNGLILLSFLVAILCMGAIEAKPLQNSAIMLGCLAYIAIVGNIEEKWRNEIEEKRNKIIPFPMEKKCISEETKIS